MSLAEYRVSVGGQISLPADVRRRWKLGEGGAVKVLELGSSLPIVPAGFTESDLHD